MGERQDNLVAAGRVGYEVKFEGTERGRKEEDILELVNLKVEDGGT